MLVHRASRSMSRASRLAKYAGYHFKWTRKLDFQSANSGLDWPGARTMSFSYQETCIGTIT